MRRLVPDGLAGRFALLLTLALVAANLIALGILSLERGRLDRLAREAREIERVLSLVPAMEAVDPRARRQIARNASTRFSRVSVDAAPVVEEVPAAPRSAALTRDLAAALPDRELRAAVLVRGRGPPSDGRGTGETIAVSVRLAADGAPQWLNFVSRSPEARPPGIEEEVFLVVLGLSLAAVLGVGLVFVRRLTRPLGALAEAARAAGQGDRTARVAEEGPREMRAAAAAFNDMQSRIEGFEAERMRTLAAVGHDLRTPITSLRIRAELLDEAEARPMIRTLDEMKVMADGLVAYARGAGDSEVAQAVDLGPMLARLCAERGVAFDAGSDARVAARPVALGRAIGNVIDNAARYGAGTRARVSLAGGEALIVVEDEGPGMPQEDLEAMFQPFVRGESSRSAETGGAGLGLAIARNIVTAHGGAISLENRSGGGLRATIRLPLRQGG